MTTNGGTIPKAAEYAMAFNPGTETASELFHPIAGVAAVYGDADGKYASWLNTKTQGAYVKDAYFFWDQPLSDSSVQQVAYVTFQGTAGAQTISSGAQPTGGVNGKDVPSPGVNKGATGLNGQGTAALPTASGPSKPKSAAQRAAAPLAIVVGAVCAAALL